MSSQMIVTVWRHGEAGRAATDRQRELTQQGVDDIGFACQRLHDACLKRDLAHPDGILHSPWVRTAQTAGIIAAAFTHAYCAGADALQPGGAVDAVDGTVIDIVSERGLQHLLLVSHQPLVSYLLEHFIGDLGAVPSLAPGALATVSMEVPAMACGRLLFSARPPNFEATVS